MGMEEESCGPWVFCFAEKYNIVVGVVLELE